MRLAVVTSSYPAFAGDPSGHFVAAEVDALVAAGHEVVVFAPAPVLLHGKARVVPLAHLGLLGWPGAVSRVRARPWRALGALPFVSGAARGLGRLGPFDRVIAHFIVPCAWPAALAAASELQVVVHGSDARLVAALPGPLRRRIVGSLLARGARFRFVSAQLRQLLADSTGFDALRNAEVEPAALDLRGAPTRADARRKLGIGAEARVIAVISRLVPAKRPGVALAAAALVPNAEILVVGDGPELPALRRRHPGVRFFGRQPRDVALACIAAADVVVSASREEGAPSVVREARALGVPVVAVRAGDLAERAQSDPDLLVISR